MPGKCNLCSKESAKSQCGGCKIVFYCNRECQITDWKNHKMQCKRTQQSQKVEFKFTLPTINKELIRIEEIENKGLGILANQDIPKGTIICKEKALISLPDYAKAKKQVFINQCFLMLSPENQNIYKSLSKDNGIENENESKNDILMQIFDSNHITIPEKNACCVFPIISRANHSCHSNAYCQWIEQCGEERLVATHDIAKNTEITYNYLSDLENLEKRTLHLKQKWNIQCQCDWCSDEKTFDEMNKVIDEYQELDKKMQSFVSNPLEGYKASQKLVKMVEKYFDTMPQLMYEHCHDCGQFALGLRKWSEASYYLESSYKYKQIIYGKDMKMDQDFSDKVNMLPTKFRSRFRKFNAKNNKNKGKNKSKNKNKKNNKRKK